MSKLGKILFFLAGLSILSFAVIRFLVGAWVPFLWVAMGLTAFFFIASLVLDRAFYKEFFGMKTTKQGLSMGAAIGLMVAGLIAVNILGVRHYKTFDLSLGHVNSLSDQSIKILSSLDSDLQIYYFYKNGTEGVEQNRHNFTDLIKQYQDKSSKVKLDFVEMNERPDLVEKYDVKQVTQLVWLEYKGRKARVEKIDEQELTSGMVKVTREKDKKIYFLSGHGEMAFEPRQDGSSISLLKKLYESSRYNVQTFSFLTQASVPADADMIFIVGPAQGLLETEVKAIEDYLKRGGSAVLALKPKMKTGFENMLKSLGIKLQDNYIASVLETPLGKGIDPRFARGSQFSATSPMTKPFGKDQVVIFRMPSGLDKINPAPAGIIYDDLVKTNASVMGFNDMKFDKSGAPGPFVLATAIKGVYPGVKDGKEFNLILTGDSDWLNEQYLYQALNRDLALNIAAYLSKEENLISISPKEIGATAIDLTPTSFTLFLFGFVIPLPVLIFITSGVLWYRRRYA